MKLKPLFDKVVIKQEEVQETTPSGIILTGSAKEKPVVATVIAVGPGGTIDGKEVKMEVKVGDKVITAGGIYGTIDAVKETYFIINIGDNVKIRIDKGSVYQSPEDVLQESK